MTEQLYATPLDTFKLGNEAATIKTYPVVDKGREESREVWFI